MGDEILYNTEGVSDDTRARQNNYEIAYNKAAKTLSELDIATVKEKSGCTVVELDAVKHFSLSFIDDALLVSYPAISVRYRDKGGEVPLWLKILALHYLVYAKGARPAQDQITFKQLEGGLGYYAAFQGRTIVPLIDTFGNDLERFMGIALELGGKRASFGDFAVTFAAFPNIEVTFILWKGDDEFPAEGNVVFDSSIASYLTTEDIAVLCNMIAVMIIKKSFGK